MAVTLVVTPAMPMTAAVIVAIMTVSRHVFVVVPVVAHKIDRPTAGVILGAVLAPVLLVSRRHVQVDWRGRNEFRRPSDHNRLWVYQLWLRDVANVDLPVKSGLADADRHAYVGSERRGGTGTEQRRAQDVSHAHVLLQSVFARKSATGSNTGGFNQWEIQGMSAVMVCLAATAIPVLTGSKVTA